VSRKTYYEWEEKSLKAMAQALENRPSGRPPVLPMRKGDPSGTDRELEKKLYLAEKTIEVKEILAAYGSFRTRTLKKPTDRQAAIRRVVEIVEEMKERTGMPYGSICRRFIYRWGVLTDGGAESGETRF